MNQSPEINELATALAAFQGEVEAVAKGEFNPFFKSKYAGLPEVVKTASPILAKHGLSVMQMLGFDGEFDLLSTRVLHTSGQYIQDTARMHLAKDDSQGHGSAVTYMRRYAYMAALGLVADVDDDGNAASKQAPTSAPQTKRRPPPQVAEISPKRRLLQACGGDKRMAEQFWADAEFGPDYLPKDTELQLLLSRAEAEMEKPL